MRWSTEGAREVCSVTTRNGNVHIESDVIVWYARNEWIVISPEPAFEGEIAQVGFRGPESVVSFDVTVLESGPTIVGNLVRHRFRLGMPDSAPRWIPDKCARQPPF